MINISHSPEVETTKNRQIILSLLRSPLVLLCAILLGGLTGYAAPNFAEHLKPFGDVFINLLFCALPLLVFFSIASTIAVQQRTQQYAILIKRMIVAFFITGIIAALLMLVTVLLYPPTTNLHLPPILTMTAQPNITIGQTLVHVFTVSNMVDLFSTEHILPLIIFSILLGLATHAAGNAARTFTDFLVAGNQVALTLIGIIMTYAPLGFFAFFAVMISHFGPELYISYGRAMLAYHLVAFGYFFIGYSLYVMFSRGRHAILPFWHKTFATSLTALSTCSSAASLPVNLAATAKLGIDPMVSNTVIPLGTMLHKEGSILGGVVKIAFLYSLFHLPLLTFKGIIAATLVSLLVGTVMGAIPSGGMLGELLILSVYGFPPQALMLIATISILIDPVATLLNVVGNTVSCVLIDTKKCE